MNEFDSGVVETLERISPGPVRDPDWLDVLDRAGVKRAHRTSVLMRWRLAVVAVAAVAAVTLSLAWPFGGSNTVIQQALAAIGSGRQTHVVIENALGSRLVDLKTGKQIPVHGQAEIWFDPKLGLVEKMSFRGTPLFVYVQRAGARPTTADAATLELISGYRAALRSGSYHVVGSGTIAGTPIYWIESKPGYIGGGGVPGPIETVVQQVAISRSTYKPLYTRIQINGRTVPGESTHVLSIQTGTPNPALFANAHRTALPNYGYTVSAPSTTVAQAAATMHREPIIPPKHLGALTRTWIGQSRYSTARPLHLLPGIEFYYGKLDAYGKPIYTGNANYISITEFPNINAVVHGLGTGSFPDNAHAVLQDRRATLKTQSLYAIVTASSPNAAITGARALVRP